MRASTIALLGAALLTACPAAWAGPSTAHYARGDKALLWFAHVTDLHLGSNEIQGPNTTEHLELTLGEAMPVIAPSFVVASGDLTDGSLNGIPYLGQDPAVWSSYGQLVEQAGMTTSSYFDLPGNHDGYGDVGLTAYLASSVQGPLQARPYFSWERTNPLGGKYRFIGLNSAGDGCAALTPQEPEFTADELAWLESELEDAADAELVVVISHHPMDEPPGGTEVTALLESYGGAFYVHGHRHAFSEYIAGSPLVVSNELGSLGQGDENNIGVGVIDHNAFIYRATAVTDPWPLVLITAPVGTTLRDSEVPNPWYYEVCKDRVDNPIRALVFSDEPPDAVTAVVAGLDPVELTLAPGSSSLWQGVVDTTSVPSGDLELSVTARVGDVERTETILPRFTSGPCDPLPDDDAGSGGAGGGSAGGAGGAGATGGTSGSGGEPTTVTPALPLPEEDGGCGCRFGGAGGGSGAAVGVLLAGLSAGRRRRRRSSRRAVS
jgi:MYXO-CTERM domain-containing protein